MLQVKIFSEGNSRVLEESVNIWLNTREVQRYKIIRLHFTQAGEYGGHYGVLVEYNDEPTDLRKVVNSPPETKWRNNLV
jgi:hypothetical protein